MLIHRLLAGSLEEPSARSTRTLRSGRSVHSNGFCSSLPDSAASSRELIHVSGGWEKKNQLNPTMINN